ncbi:MAG: Gfo/Idh/MocA family oxidoreductase [Verrucomicrobia bacterium]|nr:Gfo/Idh/MocA family oxidoreductase [Verrucomicrobiota bacterium]
MDTDATNRRIRWGVLGYGRIARDAVIPAMRRVANSEFYALGSRSEAKLSECGAQHPGTKPYLGYDGLLRDPDVDAVYIALPNSLHREWTLKAAAHGKHVLCEKPIALTAAGCREMMAACAAHGVTLMEAFMYRYTARTRQVLDMVRSGVLGEIKQVNSAFRFLATDVGAIELNPDLGGGSLYDVGCYPVNFVGMLVDAIAGDAAGGGGQPESVAVECVCAGGVDVNFAALLRYPSGLLATVQSGFNTHTRVFSEIIGTRGVLEVPDTFFGHAGALTLTVGEDRRTIAVPASESYQLEVEDFADAILQNRAPHFSLAETLRNAEVIDRLRAAMR